MINHPNAVPLPDTRHRPWDDLDQLCINAIRVLAMDAVQQANSGHPGLPMGAAPMAYVLWTRYLRHNPTNPSWPNRDRFVLSAGHGSMLLYSLLYLTTVLGPVGTPRLAVEAGVPQGWCKYVGEQGEVLGVNRFGASAPGKDVLLHYGFTVDNVVTRALDLLSTPSKGVVV